MNRRIVCAAIQCDGTIFAGARHWDSVMRSQLSGRESALDKRFEQQGFIDNQGSFLSRTDAWRVANAAGQIIRRVGGDTANDGTLYSENLY